jgi:hypothetical protein
LTFTGNGNSQGVCIDEDIWRIHASIVEWKMIAAEVNEAYLDERA